jgi:hypothetical protein
MARVFCPRHSLLADLARVRSYRVGQTRWRNLRSKGRFTQKSGQQAQSVYLLEKRHDRSRSRSLKNSCGERFSMRLDTKDTISGTALLLTIALTQIMGRRIRSCSVHGSLIGCIPTSAVCRWHRRKLKLVLLIAVCWVGTGTSVSRVVGRSSLGQSMNCIE